MTRHKHQPLHDGSASIATIGGPVTLCRTDGRPCPTTCDHVPFRCRCGATGVACPSRQRALEQGAPMTTTASQARAITRAISL
jgi:hypothetical protein